MARVIKDIFSQESQYKYSTLFFLLNIPVFGEMPVVCSFDSSLQVPPSAQCITSEAVMCGSDSGL